MTTVTHSSESSHFPLPCPLNAAPSLDDMHLALGQIGFRREYRPPSPPSLSTPNSKHLELLN